MFTGIEVMIPATLITSSLWFQAKTGVCPHRASHQNYRYWEIFALRNLTGFLLNANASSWHSPNALNHINEGVERTPELLYPSVTQLTA
jgi:hypothetical protein